MKIDKNILIATIIENQARHHMRSREAIAEKLNITHRALNYRIANPGRMKVEDAAKLFEVCKFTDEQVLKVLKIGVRR